MLVRLIVVGKTTEAYLKTGEEKYLQKIKHYLKFQYITLPETKGISDIQIIKSKDTASIISQIDSKDCNIVFDENGISRSSIQFSEYFYKKFHVYNTINLIIGGPFGFSSQIETIKHEKMSLSALTFSHQMVRLFLLEQVYRVATIQKGEHYHH